ncbi:MAG TPA: hypothetical protein VHU83_23730 [Bryobacteraceae bacterium]|jgi:tRNA C32,U32 (ribose-2'-O)-methylase TrmJ|nr:hypothetical protein [Bryobacteraceae bacterium]
MSKCRPEAGFEFAAIEEFLRSVHINDQEIRLPERIDSIHISPRSSLNLAHAVSTPAFASRAASFEIQETKDMQTQLNERMQLLDQRLEQILNRLENRD